MKSFCAILTLVFLYTVAALAQPNPDTLWTRTYGGSGSDEARSIQQTPDGGYVVAGETESFGAGYSDFYLVRTNAIGDTLWTRTYGGGDYETCSSVWLTTDGGFILVGYTLSFGEGLHDGYLVKTNSLGDTLWTRTFGGSDDDLTISAQQTADGGYILSGSTKSFGTGDYDFYLVKTDSLGDTLWTRTYGGSDRDVSSSVQQTADGGYIVAGYTESFGAGADDLYLVRTDSLGDTLWTCICGGTDNDLALSVRQTSDGGFIAAGYTDSFGEGLSDFYLVKTNSLGDTLWTRTFGGSSLDAAFSVRQTADGGFIMAGYTWSFDVSIKDFYVVKTNSQGEMQWMRTYGGSEYDEARCIRETADGGYVIAGWTDSFGAGDYDMYVVKTGPDVSEAEPIGISVPSQYILYPAFPNPFNPTTQISFALPKAGGISLKVINLMGQEVATLAHGVQSAGAHSVTFDGSTLASGIYFYRLQAGDYIQTQKMVLLK